MKCVLVVDSWTGYVWLIKEATHFDSHPFGEGGDRFRLVEVERTSLSMDEWQDWVPHPTEMHAFIRVPKVKYDVRQLRDTKFKVASNLKNKVKESALKVVNVSDYVADLELEHDKFDTKKNALITVGTLGAFATVTLGFVGSNGGDSVEIGATALGFYQENPVVPHALKVAGTLPGQGVIIQAPSGNVFTSSGNTVELTNVHVRGVTTRPSLAIFVSGTNNMVSRCRAEFADVCFRFDTGCFLFNNLAVDGNDGGFFTTSSPVGLSYSTAVNCIKVGIRMGSGSGVVACQSIASGLDDYTGGNANLSMGNVSSGVGAPIPGSSSDDTATTAVFNNYALGDFSPSATAITFFGNPGVEGDFTGLGRRRTGGAGQLFYPGAYDGKLDTGVTISQIPLGLAVKQTNRVDLTAKVQ